MKIIIWQDMILWYTFVKTLKNHINTGGKNGGFGKQQGFN